MHKDILESLENELSGFVSDDGKHHVEWIPWYNEENDITYPTWVCIDHSKRYYTDCVYSAQV